MIQLTDTSELSAIQEDFTRTVSAHFENWNDDVFSRLESQYVSPVLSDMSNMISEADSNICQICSTYSQMAGLASRY